MRNCVTFFQDKKFTIFGILKDIFKDSSAHFNIKKSKNEKYTSVSVKIIAKDPDLIINNYKKVAKVIENVILL